MRVHLFLGLSVNSNGLAKQAATVPEGYIAIGVSVPVFCYRLIKSIRGLVRDNINKLLHLLGTIPFLYRYLQVAIK